MKRREENRRGKSAPSCSGGAQAYTSVRRDSRRTDGVFPLAYLSVALSTLSPARSTDRSTFSPARSIGPSLSQAVNPPSNKIPANTGTVNFLKLAMRCPPLVMFMAATSHPTAALARQPDTTAASMPHSNIMAIRLLISNGVPHFAHCK
jgi:hypothetical protein